MLSVEPIVASIGIGSPSNFLQYIISNILANLSDNGNYYHIKDSFEAKDKFNTIYLPPNYIYIALDVISFFQFT